MNSDGSDDSQQGRPPAGLRHFTKVLVAATLILIFLGGQVKSNNAGLAVPDWPTSFGVNMFLFHWSNWVGGIFHEHLHRLVASLIGVLTIGLVVWLALREPREWVRLLGFVALITVILQGVLGGLTVIFLLPTPISVSHAVLAQSFFVLVIVIAYSQSSEYEKRTHVSDAESSNTFVRPALAVFGLIYLQLILGALMRHTESGLAIPDFPTTAGRLVPWFGEETLGWINAWRADYSIDHEQHLEAVSMGQVLIHFAHRVGATLVTGAVVFFTAIMFRNRESMRAQWPLAHAMMFCLLVQLVLGASTVWTQKVPIIASLHVAVGAALLGLSTLAVLRALTFRAPESDAAGTEAASLSA